MKIKLFTKEDCPNCPPAKKVCAELEGEGIAVEYHDTGNPAGLAESMLYSVMATPTSVLVDDNDDEVESWRGTPPDKEQIKNLVDGN